MFTFAKLVSSSLTFLTVGSTGAIVAPAALDSSIYQPTKKLKGRLDLQPLNSSEQEFKDRLDELKSKFGFALKVTRAAKNLKHKKMKDKFEEIKQKEESLKDKYEKLTKKIEKLSKLLKQQSTESMKKLYMQSAISLLEAYEGYFQKLTEHFESQKKTILEMVCTIDKTQNSSQDPKKSQETQSNQPCATEEWLKRLKEEPQSPQADTSSAPPTEASASKEALTKLMEVRGELYKLSQDVEAKETGMKEGKTRAERAKTFLKTYSEFIDGLVDLLKTYQDRVKREIEEGTKESKNIVAKINSLSEEIVLTNRE